MRALPAQLRCGTRGLLLAAAVLVLLPAPAAALGAMGQVTVNLNGFEGWYMKRDRDLEIHFAGRVTQTHRDGVFRFRDVRSHDAEREFGLVPDYADGRSDVLIDRPSENYVRILVGRKRVTLPIAWRGEVRDGVMVLLPVECEVIAGGRGACETVERPLDEHERYLRQRYGMSMPSRLEPPAEPQRRPLPIAPAEAQPARPGPPPPPTVDGGPVFEPIAPTRQGASPGVVVPQRPAPPPPAPDDEPEPDIVEPMR